MIGTFLLWLPWSRTHNADLIDLLFTAASAITVTGLVTLDTGSDFTPLGQLVIALLIQAGGIGYMLTGTLLLLGRSRFVSLRQQSTMGVSSQISEGVSLFALIRFVILFSLITVMFTSLLLTLFWIPEFGWVKGIGYSLFHAISAFNNAGFALFPSSLVGVAGGNWVIWIHAMAFIIGGLGLLLSMKSVPHKSV